MCINMNNEVKKLSVAELLDQYPIKSEVEGWYLRADEVSANVYLVEGCDRFGRKISFKGTDCDKLLTDANNAAIRMHNDNTNT